MTYRVRVRSNASAEFAEATGWYAERSPRAAARFVTAVEAAFEVLRDGAHRFPVILLDIRRVGVPRFPYSLYFKIRGGDCFVIAILHGRRHPRRWQSRSEA